MSDGEREPPDVFNVEHLRSLVELMREFDLSAVDLREADRQIRLKRGAEPAAIFAAPSPAAAYASQSGAAPAAPKPADDEAGMAYIKSPMVGTFYSAAKPGAEPFVKVGDHIGEESTVCVIEAMKMFTEIQAEVSGRIVAVLVKNEEPVDVNKPLFKVDTSQ